MKRSDRDQAKRVLSSLKKDVALPSSENSIAIVVTFNPDPSVSENLKRIRQIFYRVIVVDNSGKRVEADVQNANRFGLAGALNLGIELALKRTNEGWVFFFDQDTLLHESYLKTISEVLKHENATDLLTTYYGVAHEPHKIVPGMEPLEKVRNIITSSSFLRSEMLVEVGPFLKELFIDLIDHEYCLRIRYLGLEVKRINKNIISHQLGNELSVRLGPLELKSSNHAAFRWYYFTRNYIFLAKKWFPHNLYWIASQGSGLMKYFIKVLVIEADKISKLKSAFRGLVDGLLSRGMQ